MKAIIIGACAACVLVVATASSVAPLEDVDVKSLNAAERAGYAIGHDLGVQALARVREDQVTIDPQLLLRGFQDAVHDADPLLDPVTMSETLAELERDVTTRLALARFESDPVFRALAEDNLNKSRDFHTRFGAESDVTTLPNGVQYRVIETGTGASPTDSDLVVVAFEGSLLDGYSFGTSDGRPMHVQALLPGGRDIIQRMNVGDRWSVAMPPSAAFGIGGRTPDIGPNETILLDVTLIGIE